MNMIWLIAIMLMSVLVMLANLIQKKNSVDKDLWKQFECGFGSMNPSHIPFSFQFFLIALLFLVFDVEIALILSYPMEMVKTKTTIMVFSFILTLTLGLLYEWQKSKTKWSEWAEKLPCKKN